MLNTGLLRFNVYYVDVLTGANIVNINIKMSVVYQATVNALCFYLGFLDV